METKEFFKRFRWEAFCPELLYFIIGVMTAAMYPAVLSESAGYGYEFSVAALSLLAGAAVLVAYFLGRNESILRLLSGVGSVSVAVYLFVPTLVRWSVVPIALGIALVLHGASMFYDGFLLRKEHLAQCVVRAAAGVVFAVLGGLSCGRLFSAMADNWVFAGVVYLAQAVVSAVFAALGGFFAKQEELRFRPVKKSEPQPEEEKEETAEEEETEERPAQKSAHRRR